MVKEPTWLGNTAEGTSTSCIDHCYTNVPEKIKSVQVQGAGNSDHRGMVINKFTKFPVSKPQSVNNKNYKDFDVEKFLTDIKKSKKEENKDEDSHSEETKLVRNRQLDNQQDISHLTAGIPVKHDELS